MSQEVPVPSEESSNDGSEVTSDSIQASENSATPLAEEAELTKDSIESSKVVEGNSEDIHDSKPADNEARLQQLEKEHENLNSQYMRIAADFDNFRKRQTRDQDDLRLQLMCNTLSEILPIVDNFERARQQLDPQGEEAQTLHRSYQGLYKQLVDVLKQLGVAPMRVVGQAFDPTLHEAVMREPSQDHVEDVVLEELQRGYHLNGRVLRHALVKVSMGPGPQTDSSEKTVQNTNDASSLPIDSELTGGDK